MGPQDVILQTIVCLRVWVCNPNFEIIYEVFESEKAKDRNTTSNIQAPRKETRQISPSTRKPTGLKKPDQINRTFHNSSSPNGSQNQHSLTSSVPSPGSSSGLRSPRNPNLLSPKPYKAPSGGSGIKSPMVDKKHSRPPPSYQKSPPVQVGSLVKWTRFQFNF